MQFDEIVKKHGDLLQKVLNDFYGQVDKLQEALYTDFYNDFVSKLTSDGKIKQSGASALNTLPAWRKYHQSSRNLAEWIVDKINEIIQSAAEYFGFVTKKKVTKEVSEVAKLLLDRLGFDGKKFVSGGILESLTMDITAERLVKAIAIQAINAGRTLQQFQKQLKYLIVGDKAAGRAGVVESHYKTNANTLFAEFDRALSYNVAVKYELTHILWSGPVVRDSRSFCRKRKGKVFTIEQVKEFDKLSWPGKIPGQSTIISGGGYNCIDNLLYITSELAETL